MIGGGPQPSRKGRIAIPKAASRAWNREKPGTAEFDPKRERQAGAGPNWLARSAAVWRAMLLGPKGSSCGELSRGILYCPRADRKYECGNQHYQWNKS